MKIVHKWPVTGCWLPGLRAATSGRSFSQSSRLSARPVIHSKLPTAIEFLSRLCSCLNLAASWIVPLLFKQLCFRCFIIRIRFCDFFSRVLKFFFSIFFLNCSSCYFFLQPRQPSGYHSGRQIRGSLIRFSMKRTYLNKSWSGCFPIRDFQFDIRLLVQLCDTIIFIETKRQS